MAGSLRNRNYPTTIFGQYYTGWRTGPLCEKLLVSRRTRPTRPYSVFSLWADQLADDLEDSDLLILVQLHDVPAQQTSSLGVDMEYVVT